MKFLAHYLEKYKKESILAPVFKMLEAIFELLVPLVMAHVIDYGIAAKDRTYVIHMCLLLVILAIVGFISAITAQYYAAKAAIKSATAMKKDMFHKIQEFSFESLENFGTSTLVTRLVNDINQIQNGINMFLRLFLRSPFIVFGAVVMAAVVDLKATVIFFLVIGSLFLVVLGIMHRTLPMFKNIQQSLDGVLSEVSENLEGVRVLRAFGQKKTEKAKFEERLEKLYQKQIRVGGISSFLNPVTYVMVNAGIIGLLWFCGGQVSYGRLTQGETVALINYMSQILVELIKLANLIVQLTHAIPCIRRVEEVMEAKTDNRRHEEQNESEKKEEPAVVFDKVSFAYPNTPESAIQNVSVSAGAGDIVGIIGGTGSGKSTMMELLQHSYDVTEGEIRIFGYPVQTYPDAALSKLMAAVPQEAQLFSGTIRENLQVGNADATDEEIWQAIEQAQAKEVVLDKEKQLEEYVVKGGHNFSGGQKQRLTIARALLKKPAILILDDSASALDLQTEAKLKMAIHNLPWKPVTFWISQRASSVKSADQIVVLENGICQGVGKHEGLMKTCEVYREIFYSQFPKEENSYEK